MDAMMERIHIDIDRLDKIIGHEKEIIETQKVLLDATRLPNKESVKMLHKAIGMLDNVTGKLKWDIQNDLIEIKRRIKLGVI